MAQPDPPLDLAPLCPDDFKRQFWGDDICSLLRQLLLTNDRLNQLFAWMFEPDGSGCKLSAEFAAGLVGLSSPIGTVIWSPVDLLLDIQVWVPCDGKEYPRESEYKELYNVIGSNFNTPPPDDANNFRVPNLKGRFILGDGKRTFNVGEPETVDGVAVVLPTREPGVTGGTEEVTLTSEQALGEHKHGMFGMKKWQVPPAGDGSGQDWGWPYRLNDDDEPDPIEVKPFKGLDGGTGFDDSTTSNFRDYNRITATTTEPLSDSNDPGEAHDNMPPYMTGKYYIRANYKINGKLLYPAPTPPAP